MWTIVGGAFATLLGAIAAYIKSRTKPEGQMPTPAPEPREPTGQHILGQRSPEYPHGMIHATPDQVAQVSVIELHRIGQYLESIHSMLVEQQRIASRERLDQAERSQAQESLEDMTLRIYQGVQELKRGQRPAIPPPLPKAPLKGKP